jgi:hypothetical protein
MDVRSRIMPGRALFKPCALVAVRAIGAPLGGAALDFPDRLIGGGD